MDFIDWPHSLNNSAIENRENGLTTKKKFFLQDRKRKKESKNPQFLRVWTFKDSMNVVFFCLPINPIKSNFCTFLGPRGSLYISSPSAVSSSSKVSSWPPPSLLYSPQSPVILHQPLILSSSPSTPSRVNLADLLVVCMLLSQISPFYFPLFEEADYTTYVLLVGRCPY